MDEAKTILLLLCLVHLVVFSAAKTDGNWGKWSQWSGWAKGLCSGNQRVRTRGCTSPMPSTDGNYCSGDNAQQQDAPVDGGWSEWAQWSICSRPCGGSRVNRTRICNNPSPKYGGRSCNGIDTEHKEECLEPCQEGRVDGGWSPWSSWSPCPSKCSKDGGALRTRKRTCDMPPPMYGGSQCKGSDIEEIIECFKSCPREGGFSAWSDWTECSKTCGAGQQSRHRLCNEPEPKGGKNCSGVFQESRGCFFRTCKVPINGGWSSWSTYGMCSESKYCRRGSKKRTRACNNPFPFNDGDFCQGLAEEEVSCPTTNCIEHQPHLQPEVAADAQSFIAMECKVKTKYSASGAHKRKVPLEVYEKLKFMEAQLRGGYFAVNTDLEEGIMKLCFEPAPEVSIKTIADNLIQSYRKTQEISGYEKPKDENEAILGFLIRVENKSPYKVKGYEFGLGRSKIYIPGKSIRIYNASFSYYTEGNYWGFLAKGTYRLNSSAFDALIYRNQSTGKTKLIGKTHNASLESLVSIKKLPKYMRDAINKTGILGVTYDKIEMARETALTVARFTGTVHTPGGIPIFVEIVKGFLTSFSIGIAFDGESYQALLETISGANADIGGFLKSVGLQVALGISVAPLGGGFNVEGKTAYSKEPLSSACKGSVPEGLLMVGSVGLPKDCQGSSFCKICKEILGPEIKFMLQGAITPSSFKLTAGFYNIKITENFYFNKVVLTIESNFTDKSKSQVTVGFQVEVKFPVNVGEVVVDGLVKSNYLYVGGLIKHQLGKEDVEGILYMRGMWRRAFGVSWLAIGNINLGITITIGSPVPVTGFRFGGQLEFGENCIYEADYKETGHCLMIQIYFGYGKPSYFYGKMSALTIGKLVRMVGGKAVPKPVAESGFPEGLSVSYSPESTIDLRMAGGPLVYQGFRFKGLLNIFGYKIFADIRYSPTEVYLDTWFDPIRLGNILTIQRNKENPKLGPKFLLHYRFDPLSKVAIPYIKCYFEGYLDLFGIEVSARLNVTMDSFELHVWGNAWGLIYSDLYVSAGYSTSKIESSHFYVRVIVDLKELTEAIKKAREAVNRAFKYAQDRLKGAINKVKREKQRCKEIMTIKCQKCYSLKCREAEENCKGFMDKAGKWIGGAINAAGKWIKNTAKKIGDGLAKVGKEIKNFFRGWRRRRSARSHRNELFDLHIRDRRFISKLICEGLVGGGCKGVSHLCYGSCKAVEHIGKGLCNVLDVAVGALKLAEKACGWINAALQFLMQMFLIHKVGFELGLGEKFKGGFMVAAEIDMTIFAQRMHFGFMFDMENKLQSLMNAKDSSLNNYKKGVKPDREGTAYSPYDPPNPFSDFDLSGIFGIEAGSTSTEERPGACLAINSRNSNENLILKGCNSTDEQQQWTFTLKGLLMNKYSGKCLDMRGNYKDYVTQRDCDDSVDAQRLECDITTRSMKRRRSQFCISASANTSPNGPGHITHLGSLKCIRINTNNALVLSSQCTDKSMTFKLSNDGHLIQLKTNLCVRPKGGRANIGASLEMVSSGCHKFAFTTRGSIQHTESRLCFQTINQEMKPQDNTKLVLGSSCEYFGSKDHAFADPQLTFTFVPAERNLHLDDCGAFYVPKDQQRFEISRDSMATVCAKFAPNLALHKLASQSSVDRRGFASRAVDGNFKFQWKDGSCTHTKEERNPWWRVDLGKEYVVTDVTIINRGEHGDRLKNFEVRVGNLFSTGSNPICHDRVRSSYDGEAVRLQCNPPIPGRFVSVEMYGHGILSMCEVIVASRIGGLVDLCLLENGGCAQICYNDCGKKTRCGCYPGFNLAYDMKACVDVDECQVNNGGCRRDKGATCVNFAGSYYCQCDRGYILKDNSLTECIDFNECGRKNGGCEQMCNNTDGGYLCTCRRGYQRKRNDPYGCQDVNECTTRNGDCSHTCINYEGGHSCKCPPGYRLSLNGRTCEEIYCDVLFSPSYGSFTPRLCQERYSNIKVGTKCILNCTLGFKVVSPYDSVTCRIDGTWSQENPSCQAVTCPILSIPQNGGVVPGSCHSGNRRYGQRCVHYCKHGYRLRGPSTRYCQANQNWSSSAAVECVKAETLYYLNCPGNIVVDLTPNGSTVQLKSRWTTPQTNMRMVKVFPANAGPNYPFPVGLNTVTYSAIDEKGKIRECDLKVDVRDVTPPVIKNCPSDILIQTSALHELVTWSEPIISDNVAIAKLQQPVKGSGSIWMAGEKMRLQYYATDTSGNAAECNFQVYVKSLKCQTLRGNDGSIINAIVPNQYYSVRCKVGKTFFGPFGTQGGMVYCNNGDYFLLSQQLNSNILPDCVEFSMSSSNSLCANGTQKFMSTDFFQQKIYYCARCPAGLEYSHRSLTCKPCPVGFYKSTKDVETCEMCPKETSTLATGSVSSTQCLALCRPGHYSTTGLQSHESPCTKCPVTSYQYLSGQKNCVSCPLGGRTKTAGATNESDCQVHPNITKISQNGNVKVKAGSELYVECLFDAFPTPTVKWTFPKGVADLNSLKYPIFSIQMKLLGMALYIGNVSKSASGDYVCIVTNSAGTVRRPFTVIVE